MIRGLSILIWIGIGLLALPATGYAQEAVLTGTITDSTGGVLPGVTVSAIHQATGNRFDTVSDERGVYRIPARVGGYQLTAELTGFTTVVRSGIQLLIGQTAAIDMQMAPSTVQETVTVSAEAPLLNVATSSLGGNISPEQVQELPVQGRNWMALAMLAPGSRMTSDTATTPLPDRNIGEQREFQLILDGQQVSSERGFGGQPRYSQESIGEFQFISNRFDATSGRSSGVQVRAITRSGTNMFSGSVRGNFRDSQFNAENPVLNRVVPIDNQQIAFTMGGPVLRDKVHFFGHFEYEREPRVSIWNTPYPAFNVELEGNDSVKLGGGRLDYQLSPNVRLMGKASYAKKFQPFGVGGTNHPAETGSQADVNSEYLGQMTQVLNNRAVNEINGGFAKYFFDQLNLTTWSNHWQASTHSDSHPDGVQTGSPRITFTGFTIAGNQFYPQDGVQTIWSIRDDFTFSYEGRGRHDLKAGAEYLRDRDFGHSCRRCMGVIDARNGPVPSNIEALFPDAFNADTWNLAAISPLVRTYDVGVGDFFTDDTRPQFGTWVQDDWLISPRLTLNLGMRYDLSVNASGKEYSVPPFVEAGKPDDTNNVAPRIGFAYHATDRTVFRGGTGLYYGTPLSVETYWMAHAVKNSVIQITNDGRPNFAADPLNGQPLPTLEQARPRFCHINNVPGCLRETVQELAMPDYTIELARSWQSSIGVQRQIGATMALEADYVYSQGRNEKDIVDNVNLTFDPATGANYPFSNIARRAYPEFGLISMQVRTGRSSYHALQTAWTKRLSNRWQASATYTLSGIWDEEALPHGFFGLNQVTNAVPDLGGEFSLGSTDLRHRAVFNGIWQVGGGFQLSGLFYTGIGERAATVYGGDLRGLGGGAGAQALRRQRLRPDGTIVPRNSFTQPPRRRVDLRAQQRIPIGRVAIDGIAEVFNVFNSPNWTINTDESSRQYMQNVAGANRTVQFGFRLTF
jgi:hypothetical protein